MRLPSLAGTALLTFATARGAHAAAAPVLDQAYLANNDLVGAFSGVISPGYRRAETFAVGIAGTLSVVDVFTFDGPAAFQGLNILSTADGAPTATVLATGTLASQSGGVAAFSVSLPVSVGKVLAIEPLAADGGWLVNYPGTYAGGGNFILNPDLGSDSFTADNAADDFRTFVTVPEAAAPEAVPEPASLVLLGTGLAGLLGFAARRRKVA